MKKAYPANLSDRGNDLKVLEKINIGLIYILKKNDIMMNKKGIINFCRRLIPFCL